MGWSSQKPVRKARERDEGKIAQWKTQRWPQIRDEAVAQGRTIVFVDESGLTQKPATKKTWSPEGQTPQIEMNFNWKTLSVIGGISLQSLYFQIHEQSVKSAQVIEFLGHLQRHIEGKLLIVWDGLPAHRSKQVQEYLKTTEGRIWLERLPAYAPELNPIEYLWGHLKNTALANFAAKDLKHLSEVAKKALRKTRRRPACIRAFWVQAELDLNRM
jgi:transposase